MRIFTATWRFCSSCLMRTHLLFRLNKIFREILRAKNTRAISPSTVSCNGLCWTNLLPVLFVLNRIHRTAGAGCQGVVKLGVLTETTGIAQERVSFVVVDGPENQAITKKLTCYRDSGKMKQFVTFLWISKEVSSWRNLGKSKISLKSLNAGDDPDQFTWYHVVTKCGKMFSV